MTMTMSVHLSSVHNYVGLCYPSVDTGSFCSPIDVSKYTNQNVQVYPHKSSNNTSNACQEHWLPPVFSAKSSHNRRQRHNFAKFLNSSSSSQKSNRHASCRVQLLTVSDLESAPFLYLLVIVPENGETLTTSLLRPALRSAGQPRRPFSSTLTRRQTDGKFACWSR